MSIGLWWNLTPCDKGAGCGFQKEEATSDPISIRGVEVVEGYEYLGVHIDNKLDWGKNTEVLYRKGQNCLFEETEVLLTTQQTNSQGQ